MNTVAKPAAVETAIVAIVDTETTGLSDRDEPISIGVVLAEVDLPKGGVIREVDAYYGTRQPRVEIDPRAAAVHGLTLESIRGTDFDLPRLRALIAKADYVVAHHCAFDARMLRKVLPELDNKRWRCSVRQIWWSDFVPVANEKLDTICTHFQIARPNPHNALDDCRALLDALSRRTGTTNRSRTFLGAALAKDDFVFDRKAPEASPERISKPRPVEVTGYRTPLKKPKREDKSSQVALAIVLWLLLIALWFLFR